MGVSRVNPCMDKSSPPAKPFPKLMINSLSGNIALFTNETTAVYLHVPNNTRNVGNYHTNMGQTVWEDYNEVLCLKND